MMEIIKIVLRKVIEQLKYLKFVGFEIKVFINILLRDFNYKGFIFFIKDILIDCEIDFFLIELEVIERSVFDKS